MKNTVIVLSLLLATILSSCQHGKQTERKEGPYLDQAELNMQHGRWYLEYKDSIEKEFQKLISAFPQYNDEYNQENAIWGKYQEAVREVAGCEDHGSSSSMYIDDVLTLGIKLWATSFRNLMPIIEDTIVPISKETFTSDMIADAYSDFIKAVGEDEYMEHKAEYQEALRKEQKCWNDWMDYRNRFSKKLAGEIKKNYDICTNQTKRTKLLQLKNQNHALGMCGRDEMERILYDNCSDEELLEYPGFDKVWAQYLNDIHKADSFPQWVQKLRKKPWPPQIEDTQINVFFHYCPKKIS